MRKVAGITRASVSALVKCKVVQVLVDFERHWVVLYVPDDECTSMEGAIEYASVLDSEVERIISIAGGVMDTQYRRDGGKWRAFEGEPCLS